MSYRSKSIFTATCDVDQYALDKCNESINVDLPGTSFEAKERMRKAGWYIGTGGTCFCPTHKTPMLGVR